MCHIFLRLNVYPKKNEHDWLENHELLIGDTSSNGCFSIAMLVFGGVFGQDMSTTGFDIFKQQRNTSNCDVLHLKPCSCAGENQRPRIKHGRKFRSLGSPNKNNLEIPAIPKRLGSWLVDGSEIRPAPVEVGLGSLSHDLRGICLF